MEKFGRDFDGVCLERKIRKLMDITCNDIANVFCRGSFELKIKIGRRCLIKMYKNRLVNIFEEFFIYLDIKF